MPLRAALLTLAVLSIAACTDTTGVLPIDPTVRELTVNANSPAYVALTDGPVALTVTDPSVSTAWDVSLNATTITTNVVSGITVHCLCGNAAASNDQIAAMTAGNQLAAFDAVTAADIPADTAFRADAFAPALTAWYTGTGAAAVADTGRVLLIRRGTTTVTFVKARITAIAGAALAGPASVTVEYADQDTAGTAFDSVRTVVLAQGARFHIASRTAGTATDWDLWLDGWSLKVNSGVSGTGSTLGIGFPSSFTALTAATAASVQPTTFRRDGFTSVFGTSPWYRYNVTGADNQIWPTFNVYLVERGDAVFKVQLTGYYNLAGASRHITIRSARLR